MPEMPRHKLSNFTKGLKEANGPPNGSSQRDTADPNNRFPV